MERDIKPTYDELESYVENLQKQLADAQATIAALEETILKMGENAAVVAKDAMAAKEQVAALQGQVRELEQWVQDQSTANLETMRHTDEMQSRALEAEQQLTQRTAELEAVEKILDIDTGKTTVEKVRDLHHSFKQVWESYQDASNEMFKAQAELERVRGELQSAEAGYFVAERDLQGMNNRYDDLRALIAALPKVEGEITANRVCTIMMHGLYCEEFTKLLQHRQGME